MTKRWAFLLLFVSSFLFCGMGVLEHREELGTLKEQSIQEEQKEKTSKAQEEAFKKVEAALKASEIKEGLELSQIRSRYGAPSAISPEGEGGQRWLYRSSKGKALEKPWIFLYFDSQSRLIRWECGHTEACG